MDDFMHSPIEDIVDYRACPDCSSPDEHLEHTLYDVQNSYTRLGELVYRKNKIIDKWEEGIHELAYDTLNQLLISKHGQFPVCSGYVMKI
ncbi:hypothetical protein [Scardovia wiggsiae]|uniref:hypothetical protein n=1 Tax=Scardovia wiggsiae TaxID=230143 RepID=UPI00374F42BC